MYKQASEKHKPVHPPHGIAILSYVYLYVSILSTLTLFVPFYYIAVQSFGVILNDILALSIRILLLLVPLYLFIGFRQLYKSAWAVAVAYHCFFIINNALSLINLVFHNFPAKPMLQIVSRVKMNFLMQDLANLMLVKGSFYFLNIAIGIFILYYLNLKKELFANGR